jgi:hypothetical protein
MDPTVTDGVDTAEADPEIGAEGTETVDCPHCGADPDLEVGAENIARNIFRGRVTARQVYRMAEPARGWPFFYLLGKLSLRPSAFRAETARREAQRFNKQA